VALGLSQQRHGGSVVAAQHVGLSHADAEAGSALSAGQFLDLHGVGDPQGLDWVAGLQGYRD